MSGSTLAREPAAGDRVAFLAERLLAGDPGPLEALFEDAGLSPPTIDFAPDAERLNEPALRALFSIWRNLGGGAPPDQASVTPERLKPALGFVNLLDASADGRDFRYRLCGSRIVQRFGRDLTGRW